LQGQKSTQSALKHSLTWTILEKAGYTLLQLITTIALGRLLSPTDFGLFGMVFIFIAISQTLVDSGLAGAVIRKKNTSNIDYSTLFIYNFASSIILYIIMFMLSSRIASFYNNQIISDIIKVSGLSIIINSLSIVQLVKLTKEFKFKQIAIIILISYFLSSALSIFMAFKGYGVWSLVALYVLQIVCNAIGLLFACSYKPSLKFSIKSFIEQFSFGVFLLFSNLIKTINNNIYSSLIGKRHSATSAGYFSQASKIESIILTITMSIIDKAIFPVLSQIDVIEEFKATVRSIMKISAFVFFPIMLLLSLLAEPILVVLLGEKWLASSKILSLLSIAGIAMLIQILSRNILKSFGKTKIIFFIEVFQLTLTAIILYVTLDDLIHLSVGIIIISTITMLFFMKAVSETIKYSIKEQISDLLPFISTNVLTYTVTFAGIYIFNGFSNYTIIIFSTLFYLAFSFSILSILKIKEASLLYLRLKKIFH